MPRPILLLCYDFPPNQGIGGRRWAKLSRALAESGTKVYVIKASPVKGNKTSHWTEDTRHPNIESFELPRNYPRVLSHPGKSFLDKISFRFWKWLLMKQYEGTPFDLAIRWEKALLNQAKALITAKGIGNIIATGAPFNLMFFSAQLKRQFPDIRFICDYRDPWLTAVNYGIPALSYPRFLQEKNKQQAIFDTADYITCPNPFMLEEIRASADYPATNSKMRVIAHFYDPNELKSALDLQERRAEKLLLVYGGTLYMDLLPHFRNFLHSLDHLRQERHDLYARLAIEIYTKDQRFSDIFANHSCIRVQPEIGKAVFDRIAQASGLLIFLAHHNKDYLTTKFIENLPFRKPLLLFGEKGYTAKYILENKLGWVSGEPGPNFAEILDAIGSGTFAYNHSFPHEQFSLNSIRQELEKILQ
jgi:hypothetical protein